MFYRNKNISYSQKLLNPIVKYMKSEGNNDKFITKNGLVTDQKVYKNRQKTSLINYIKKEGNNFFSRKKIKENEGIKHLIISPINPELYNRLNDEEKEKLKQVVIKQLFKDFVGYGFIGGIEHKKRGELDHFHIHIGISEKYDISPQNIDYLKRSITKSILKESTLKEKLGLKTASELRKETFENKYKKLYEKKIETYNNISFLFNEMININKDINKEKNIIDNIRFDIGELNSQRRTELQKIHKEKDFLISDIKGTKDILKTKNNSLKNINQEFTNTLNIFKHEKDNVYSLLKNELISLKNVLNDEMFYFKQFLKCEHNIYVKFLKHQLKNKIIDLPRFLYLVSSNKYYMKQRTQWKKEEIKQRIKSKEEYIKKRMEELQNNLKYKLRNIENRKDWIEFMKKFDEKKLKNLLNNLEEINRTKKDIIEKYFTKIDLIYKYLYRRQQKYFYLLERKKEKQEQIKREREKYNYFNKEYRETKNLMYSNEIIKIMEKYNITEDELKSEYNKYLKDKQKHPEITFLNYLNAYGRQKQYQYNNDSYINNSYIELN